MSLSQIPKKWDGEADVIVVGGGDSGLPAAMVAHDKGAKVMVLEVSGGMASSGHDCRWYAFRRYRFSKKSGHKRLRRCDV